MTNLQLFTKLYISEHELIEKDKNYLLDFVEKSSDDDILNLLLTGTPKKVSEHEAIKLNRQYEESGLKMIIDERTLANIVTTDTGLGSVPDAIAKAFWTLSKKMSGQKPFASFKDTEVWLGNASYEQAERMAVMLLTGATFVSAAAVATIFAWVTTKLAKRYLSQAGRACRPLSGKKNTICVNNYKIKMYEKQIDILKDGIKSCSKANNPGFCKAKIQAKIGAVEDKKKKLEMKNKKLEAKIKT